MTKPESADPLEPVLKDAEAELSRRLHEACVAEASGLSTMSSDEIREMEDSLLAAAVAAGQTIALRRYMKERQGAEGAEQHTEQAKAPAAKPVAPPHAADAAPPQELEPLGGGTVREFTDSEGHSWRAWPVVPGLARTGRATHYLGDYQKGWICFEALDNSARRRLPCAPTRLAETKDEDLERLLHEAIMAPHRKGAH